MVTWIKSFSVRPLLMMLKLEHSIDSKKIVVRSRFLCDRIVCNYETCALPTELHWLLYVTGVIWKQSRILIRVRSVPTTRIELGTSGCFYESYIHLPQFPHRQVMCYNFGTLFRRIRVIKIPSRSLFLLYSP